MTKFNFSEYGRVYIPINFKPKDDTTLIPINFKIDTGADTSTISKLDLADLGYNMDWVNKYVVIFKENEKPTTAAGEHLNAGYVQLPLINILEYEGKNWPFQIIIDEDKDFRNLLGRDLLTGFNYWFNNDDDEFIINRTKIFKPRYNFLVNQEIHSIVI